MRESSMTINFKSHNSPPPSKLSTWVFPWTWKGVVSKSPPEKLNCIGRELGSLSNRNTCFAENLQQFSDRWEGFSQSCRVSGLSQTNWSISKTSLAAKIVTKVTHPPRGEKTGVGDWKTVQNFLLLPQQLSTPLRWWTHFWTPKFLDFFACGEVQCIPTLRGCIWVDLSDWTLWTLLDITDLFLLFLSSHCFQIQRKCPHNSGQTNCIHHFKKGGHTVPFNKILRPFLQWCHTNQVKISPNWKKMLADVFSR